MGRLLERGQGANSSAVFTGPHSPGDALRNRSPLARPSLEGRWAVGLFAFSRAEGPDSGSNSVKAPTGIRSDRALLSVCGSRGYSMCMGARAFCFRLTDEVFAIRQHLLGLPETT